VDCKDGNFKEVLDVVQETLPIVCSRLCAPAGERDGRVAEVHLSDIEGMQQW
jgi:hypothetical protein